MVKRGYSIFILTAISCFSFGWIAGAQVITTVAGSGIPGYSGDGGAATVARLFQPSSVAVNDSGDLYIVDNSNDNIRKVSAKGIISTIAGDLHRKGMPGIGDVQPCFTSDGGPATNAIIWKPQGIATDHSGNVYFIEVCGGVRKIAADGIISTVASNRRLSNYNVDSDLAANSMRYEPRKICIDKKENIYYADEKANAVRKISKSGIVSNVAGNGSQGFSGDGNAATAAKLSGPYGVAVDDTENVYINDRGNGRIRKVNTAGIIITIAGNGETGYSGDGGPALNASFNDPRGIAVDHCGNLYVADTKNDAVRRIDANGIISTFAGSGKHLYRGDGGLAAAAQLYRPTDVIVDRNGNVFIADGMHYVIRKVTVPPCLPKAAPEPVADTSDIFTISADMERNELVINTAIGAYATYIVSDSRDHELKTGTITGSLTRVDMSTLPAGWFYITVRKGDRKKVLRFFLDR